MNNNQFRKFLREYYTLAEAETPPDLQMPEDKGETSLDDQVDRLLTSYEKEAKKTKNEGKDWRFSLRKFLLEADEDPAAAPDASAGDAPPADTGAPTPAGGEEAPKKETSEDIDIDSFAESVVRLIDNYDSLLEVRDTLVRRAQNFLKKNYDEQTVSDFKSVLRDTFDIEVGMTDFEKQEKNQPPSAARAGKGTE